MRYIRSYEFMGYYDFKIGEYVWSKAFKKFYKVVDITDRTLWIEDENGHRAEFLKFDFIPKIEYDSLKYNL